jgi:hypothetical protein
VRYAVFLLLILGVLLDVARARGADVEISGIVDVVHREGDKRSTINNNLAGTARSTSCG